MVHNVKDHEIDLRLSQLEDHSRKVQRIQLPPVEPKCASKPSQDSEALVPSPTAATTPQPPAKVPGPETSFRILTQDSFHQTLAKSTTFRQPSPTGYSAAFLKGQIRNINLLSKEQHSRPPLSARSTSMQLASPPATQGSAAVEIQEPKQQQASWKGPAGGLFNVTTMKPLRPLRPMNREECRVLPSGVIL